MSDMTPTERTLFGAVVGGAASAGSEWLLARLTDREPDPGSFVRGAVVGAVISVVFAHRRTKRRK